MECEKFLVEYGLYDKQKIEYEDFTDLINLLSSKVKIDVYCSKCKEKRRTLFIERGKKWS